MFTTQFLRSGKSSGTTPDDHDLLWLTGSSAPAPVGLPQFLVALDKDLIASPLDRPARKRTQGRWTQGLAGAQVEARVMPRATHRFAFHQPIDERAAVVGAGRSDSKELVAVVGDEHGVIADMAHHLMAVRNVVERDAFDKVRTEWCRYV